MNPFPASEAAESSFAEMDALAARGEDFLFAVDYELSRAFALPLREADPALLLYDFRGRGNAGSAAAARDARILSRDFVPFAEYERAFRVIREGEERGDSFLANLTFPTRVSLSDPLRAVFRSVSAPYRLWLGSELAGDGAEILLFSPEPFVRTKGREISTRPMKGTAPASAPGAAEALLADGKEAAEHATVVDLLRNDLALVARDVEVARYRYLEAAGSGPGALIQSSSEVMGELRAEFAGRPGSILSRLLPAGSVTGAPKRSTVELIARAEGRRRGWYCGVCGVWRGGELDSAVMIRFIESGPGGTFFRSGGGVTVYSDARAEYAEMVAKVRLPR